jgi:hypothetical protein
MNTLDLFESQWHISSLWYWLKWKTYLCVWSQVRSQAVKEGEIADPASPRTAYFEEFTDNESKTNDLKSSAHKRQGVKSWLKECAFISIKRVLETIKFYVHALFTLLSSILSCIFRLALMKFAGYNVGPKAHCPSWTCFLFYLQGCGCLFRSPRRGRNL